MQNNAIFVLAILDVLVGIASFAIGDKNSKLKSLLALLFVVLLIVIIGIYFIPSPVPPAPTPTPTLTKTPEVIAIAGKWEGITTGTNAGSPISERATLVSIQDNCQTGHTCGFFSTEGACVYELTLLEIQGDDRYIFEAIAVSGAEFCLGTSRDQVTLTSMPNSTLDFYYETTGAVVVREGNLIRASTNK